MKEVLVIGSLLAGLAGFVYAADEPGRVSDHDVVWASPSENSLGSMPLGNGDIGANVWVEPSGDLVLLLSKTDAFDDFARLLKIGRVRIQTSPALVQPGAPFKQTLNLREGCIDIEAGTTTVRIWIDAHHPVVQVDMEHTAPVTAKASVELWRTETRMLDRRHGNENEGNGTYENFPDMRKVHPDVVLPHNGTRIAWCHHNTESIWERNMRHTGLKAEIPNHRDPLLHRTFGAVMHGKGMQTESDLVLASAQPSTTQSIQITVLTDFADSPADWRRAAEELADRTPADTAARFAAHRDWWQAFWERSWIAIDGSGSSLFAGTANAHPWRVGVDSNGASRFGGEIAGAKVESGARTAFPEAVAGKPSEKSTAALPAADVVFNEGLTISAWIKPAAGETGRIFDKVTAGQPDGCLFDTHPGLSLRWIVGRNELSAPGGLKPDRWQHVAATADPSTGAMRIFLDGNLVKEEIIVSPAMQVSQAYALQRFINAAAGRGHLPIKFNGSLFTVDEVFDADYRRWGGPYWLQNTRLPYWSMLYSGDYDLIRPLFKMYRDQLPLRTAATKTYFGHDGAYFPETAHFWGNYADGNYGFDRGDLPHGITQNHYIRRHWVGIIEIVGMMLDYYEATGDAAFRDDTLIPMAVETFRFYDQHWKRDENGRIRYDPAQSLESYFEAVNPTPDIASMRYLIPRLLALPVADDIRAEWKRQLADQPEIPIIGKEGNTRIAPAHTFGGRSNFENPELYAVFPFHLYTLATASEDELQTAIRSFHARAHSGDNFGWNQSPVWAALLGLTDQARTMVVGRARNNNPKYRFPGFYGPFHDWTPDQDHVGVFQIALQRMLMQCEGDRILLLPAWPKDWNCEFKLHAPYQTVIEGRVENGKVLDLKVTPESRRADVQIMGAKLDTVAGGTPTLNGAAVMDETESGGGISHSGEVLTTDSTIDFTRMIPSTLSRSMVFRQEGWHVWDPSIVVDEAGVHHLFYSRWPSRHGFDAWCTHAEIARAESRDGIRPYVFQEVVLPARGADFWDGHSTYNTCVVRIQDTYYLYYTGNRGLPQWRADRSIAGLSPEWWTHRNNQRIGVAVADAPTGPWTRRDNPLVDIGPGIIGHTIINVPNLVVKPEGGFRLYYKTLGEGGKSVIHYGADADSPLGPFVTHPQIMVDKNKLMPQVETPFNFHIDDHFEWIQDGRYYAIVKDHDAPFLTRHGKSLLLFESPDGRAWRPAANELVTGFTIEWDDGGKTDCSRLEMPKILFRNGQPRILSLAGLARSGGESFIVNIPLLSPNAE